MNIRPKIIALDQIAEVIAEKFNTKDEITCCVGSNAATPAASLTALTDVIKLRRPRLPFIKRHCHQSIKESQPGIQHHQSDHGFQRTLRFRPHAHRRSNATFGLHQFSRYRPY